ncbi:MAG: polysaccharide deacetylase family protein [Firmicutes bacterium]|nr:polysaccharide deacetylase family protein [Bacillota bacterium]
MKRKGESGVKVFYFPWPRVVVGALIVSLALSLAVAESVTRLIPALATNERLVPIYSVETPVKKVAISFDAAWGADKTGELLDTLEKYNVKTTFFLVDFWMEKYPEMTKKIATSGHEIGNHSATHPHMSQLSEEEIRQELIRTNERIKELTGQEPLLFRPPFGEYNNLLIQTVEKLGMLTIQWDVDSLDWQDLSSTAIVERVLDQVKPGSIVLFHNNALHTPEALPTIIEKLQADGYQIVPVSELIYKDHFYIESHSGRQRPKSGPRPV